MGREGKKAPAGAYCADGDCFVAPLLAMTTTCCHCERSEAISRRIVLCRWGLLRRSAPRNDETAMIAYAIRRIALMLPTLFAIMVVNFFIVQAAPGGPIQQMISKLKG